MTNNNNAAISAAIKTLDSVGICIDVETVHDAIDAAIYQLHHLQKDYVLVSKGTEIPEEFLIMDEQILAAWGNANFGENTNHRQIILDTLLKIAGGYSTSHTALSICRDLGLVGRGKHVTLTKRGCKVMYHWNKTALLHAANRGD